MRISLYSKASNLAFMLGVFLKRKGHQVRVFVDVGAADHERPNWESVDGDELAAVPVELVDVDVKRLLVGGRRERRFRDALATADVVQTFGEGVVWSASSGAPDTVLSIGDDLDILPFRHDSLRIRIYARMLRRAQQRCRAVCYTMPPQQESCRKLGLGNARFLPCAIPIDTDRYCPVSRAERSDVRARLGMTSDALVIFHPSRQEWTCPEQPGSNHKGNDRFLRAYARFRQDWGKNVWLIAVTKGRDVGRSQALARELGVADSIRWIPQQNKAGLRDCLGASDIVADQFTYGFYGISALEAMSVGRPVLVHLERGALEAFGIEPPPVVSVKSEEEIYHALCRLAENRVWVEEIGAAARGWIIRHHRWDTVAERYVALYKELV